MSWKDLFDEEALEAGFDLYLAKAVKRLSIDGNDVYAEVKDSFIEITLTEGGDIVKALVDGKEGRPELVAAVMYEVTDPVVQNAYLQDVLDMIERADEADLKEFLEDLVIAKPSVANDVRRWFGAGYADMESLEDDLDDIFSGYDPEWLSEGGADALSSDIQGMLRKYVPSLAAQDRYEDLSALLTSIEERLSGYDAETGAVEQLLSAVILCAASLCGETGVDGRRGIFMALLEAASSKSFGEYTDVLERLLIDNFKKEDETEALLGYVDDELGIMRDIVPRQRYVLYKAKLLENQGKSGDEVMKGLGKDWDQPSITVKRSKELSDKGLKEEAVNLLLASYDRASSQYARGVISRELLDLYRELGRKDEEVKELVRFLSTYYFSLDTAGRLRDLTSDEEWAEAKATLSGTLGLDERLGLYQWDDDKKALLDELQRNGSVEDIWEYAEDLVPEYSKEVAELASSRVIRELEKAGSRTDYHYLGAFFREMAELMPEERQVFWQTYGMITEMFPRNTALRQELRTAFKSLREL